MSERLPYPEFASEAEEADWLYEHREDLDLYFSPMNISVREMLLRDHDLVLPAAFVSVPLSAEDLERMNTLAASKGLQPAEYLSEVVHDLLEAKQAA